MEQPELMRFAVETLTRIGIPYFLVGSYASSAYGEPRLPQDIDIVVALLERHVKPLCAAFAGDEFYVSESAAPQAARTGLPFNILLIASGNKIYLIPNRVDEWGRSRMQYRRQLPLFANRSVFVARPEDVILGKMLCYTEGGHEKHLRDITGMLRLCPEPIDRDDIARWAAKLGLTDIWQAILTRLGESPA